MRLSRVMRVRASQQLSRRRSTAPVMAFFWAAAAVAFSFALKRYAGSEISLPVLWCMNVAPLLPVAAAFIGMDSVSSERSSGRLELLFTTPAPAGEFILGRFTALFFKLAQWLAVLLVAETALLRVIAPSVLSGVDLVSFIPAFAALLVQALAWAAAVTAAGSFTRNAALCCLAATGAVCVIPRLAWYAFSVFLPQCGFFRREFIFDVHAADFASGIVSLPALFSYVLFAVFALYAAARHLDSLRYAGAGGRGKRFAAAAANFASVLFLVSVIAFVSRFDITLDIPLGGSKISFSPAVTSTLSDTRGDISAVCLISRRDTNFRHTASYLRALAERSGNIGAADFKLSFVDPDLDPALARIHMRSGVKAPSVVFERGRRRAVLDLSGGMDERKLISALRRLVLDIRRSKVCWTSGHGEISHTDYGPHGMSDIARELMREGCKNETIDLSGESSIPSGCAFLIVAGAKTDMSRREIAKIDSYLGDGGRMLVITSSADRGGVLQLLPKWGVRPVGTPAVQSPRSFTGTDVIASDFGPHPVSSPLEGAQTVFDSPIALEPAALAAVGEVSADGIAFYPLASSGGSVFAAASERGAAAGTDLSLRPTRIVVIGDESFVMNSQLKSRANANRDLFMNAVSYLSGSDPFCDGSSPADARAIPGMDLLSARIFLVSTAAGFPLAALFVMIALRGLRRRSK